MVKIYAKNVPVLRGLNDHVEKNELKMVAVARCQVIQGNREKVKMIRNFHRSAKRSLIPVICAQAGRIFLWRRPALFSAFRR